VTRVVLHVGPPKTGSTYLQDLLWAHRGDLARQGVLLPIDHPNEAWLAAVDVQDGAFVHVDVPEAAGAWERVTGRVPGHPGRAVISCELLGLSTDAHVARIAASFGPAELHVVVMARGLAAALPSLWQETVKMVDPDRSWEEFLQASRDERSAWTDPAGIVRRWLAHLPPSRVHVVTVPPRGTDPEVLLRRFGGVLGIDVRGWTTGPPANESLGDVQVELLRRVTRLAAERTDRRAVQRLVNDEIVPRLARARVGRRLRVPLAHRPWIEDETARRRRDLEASGAVVHGVLDDLDPGDDDWDPAPRQMTDSQLLDAALALLVAGVAGVDGQPGGSEATVEAMPVRWARRISSERRNAGPPERPSSTAQPSPP
jgi:hypothetical protein